MFEIEHIYLSPAHNYFGHHGLEADAHPVIEVDAVECVAGRGLRGDRFFDYKPDYRGQITFFSGEVYDDLCATLLPSLFPTDDPAPAPSVFRRNVITRGIDLNTLIDVEFAVGDVHFLGCTECSPCHWMNRAFAHGAEAALKGRGGLRAKILRSGLLRRTPVAALVSP